MSVNGVGGSAMLGMTLSSTSRTEASAATSAPSTASGVTRGTGDVRLPGQPHGTASAHETAPKHKEIAKPPALPPLRGLTVAEIRAMLGVARMPGQTEAAAAEAATASTSIIAASLKTS
jgi:hypothetical protein